MVEYILPVEIVLNPPDVILNDIYAVNENMFLATYRVMYVAFGMNSVRFLGTNSEENRTNEIKSTYLLWNRSFYYADMFVKPVGISSIMYSIEEETIPNIITSVLVPLISKISPFNLILLISSDELSIIKGYGRLNIMSCLMEYEPTEANIIFKLEGPLFTTKSTHHLLGLKIPYLLTGDFKPNNINFINYYIKKVEGFINIISANINDEIKNIDGFFFNLMSFHVSNRGIVKITNNLYENFAKIIIREEKIDLIKNVYLKQTITFTNKG